MATLPASTVATSPTATEGDVKTFLTEQRAFIADLLGTDSANKAAALSALGAALNGSSPKVSNYTIVAADRGKVITATGTITINVAAAATLGDGFVFGVWNTGSGTVTIDPNLTEQINNANTLVIGAGGFAMIYCNGSAFSAVGAAALAGNVAFTTAGAHTFTVPAGVTLLKRVTVLGGGGGGGSAPLGTGSAGGGGGGCGVLLNLAVTPGSSIAVTVGAGGAAAGAGGASAFGAHVSASGGGGGTASTRGAGGSATGATLSFPGTPGGTGMYGGDGVSLGYGGEGGCATGPFSGAPLAGPVVALNANGFSAVTYGGGGTGAHAASAPRTGGTGAAGLVVVEW